MHLSVQSTPILGKKSLFFLTHHHHHHHHHRRIKYLYTPFIAQDEVFGRLFWWLGANSIYILYLCAPLKQVGKCVAASHLQRRTDNELQKGFSQIRRCQTSLKYSIWKQTVCCPSIEQILIKRIHADIAFETLQRATHAWEHIFVTIYAEISTPPAIVQYGRILDGIDVKYKFGDVLSCAEFSHCQK